AGTRNRAPLQPRALGRQAHPVALAEAPVFLCSKVRKRPIELFIILAEGGAPLDRLWRRRVQVDDRLGVEAHESIPIVGVQRSDARINHSQVLPNRQLFPSARWASVC